jgi:hypothetical protein
MKAFGAGSGNAFTARTSPAYVIRQATAGPKATTLKMEAAAT